MLVTAILYTQTQQPQRCLCDTLQIVLCQFWRFFTRGPESLFYLTVVKYNVSVHTSDKFGAGTDANVFCNIFGEMGDTGERPLSKSATNRNKFERKNVSVLCGHCIFIA